MRGVAVHGEWRIVVLAKGVNVIRWVKMVEKTNLEGGGYAG